MAAPGSRLTSAVEAAVVAGLTIVTAPPVVLFALVGRRDRARRLALTWCRRVLGRLGVTMSVRGLDRLPATDGWVAVANHRSRFDGRCLYLAFEGDADFAVSRRMSLVPFFGQAMLSLGFLIIDRRRTGASIRRIQQAEESFRRGRRVLFFPEGRRTDHGPMLPFKSGAFMLAVGAQVPLIPVAVIDRGESGRGPIEIVVGSPVSTAGCDRDDVPRLKATCRRLIEEMMRPSPGEASRFPPQLETTLPAASAMMRSARSASSG